MVCKWRQRQNSCALELTLTVFMLLHCYRCMWQLMIVTMTMSLHWPEAKEKLVGPTNVELKIFRYVLIREMWRIFVYGRPLVKYVVCCQLCCVILYWSHCINNTIQYNTIQYNKTNLYLCHLTINHRESTIDACRMLWQIVHF